MPLFDFRCIKCGRDRKDVLVSNWRAANGNNAVQRCECGGEMRKQPAAPAHVVNGFNAKNGYSSNS